ncbi:hypothetical protein FNYG_13589 [Fusarium nygamai]|uniref:Uncharacterized protein n=1 Tax=Gibberella nygamai TaxID=42673 RepID=A0A2K0UV61_GIBNY|nr:hypothetical protein FNYG_13589 [Fusarium nygamai]
MTIARTSVVLLRSGTRPAFRSATGIAPLRRPQVRQQSAVSSDGDIGGPGGQQVPPPNPSGPELLKRNWYICKAPQRWHSTNPRQRLPIGGAAVLITAVVSYMSSSSGSRPQGTEGET